MLLDIDRCLYFTHKKGEQTPDGNVSIKKAMKSVMIDFNWLCHDMQQLMTINGLLKLPLFWKDCPCQSKALKAFDSQLGVR